MKRIPLFAYTGALLALAAQITACSATSDAPEAAANNTPRERAGEPAASQLATDGPSTDYHSPRAPESAPQVVNAGGPVMSSPEFVPIFFSNDDARTVSAVEDFMRVIGSTSYWSQTTAEYGVGAATSAAPIELAEEARGTIDDTAIQSWLTGKLNSDDPAFPAATPDRLYVIFYPASVTVTADGDASCVAFGGYHANVALDAAHGGAQVAYAVIPRCSDFGALTGLDVVTGTTSHELIEAATDPYPMTTPAYVDVDPQHAFWSGALGGGETGDMCAQYAGSFTRFPEIAYTVQRSWSNQAALAGHDPCVPVPAGEVYFNSVPALDDDISMNVYGQRVTAKGVKIAPGHARTIDVDLFSDGDPGGPWSVSARELSGGSHLDFALNRTHGQSGDKLRLTISVRSASAQRRESFIVVSRLGQRKNVWFGMVGN
jgi:hypothetical protein